MDKLLRDMDALCQTTAREREEMCRAYCRMAEISEILLSNDEIACDGGTEVRVPMEWKEQQVEEEEMARIMARDDLAMVKQDMAEYLDYMKTIKDCSMDDVLDFFQHTI